MKIDNNILAKNILFRADSSSSIGTGHIMRDLVLASYYKEANVIFAVQDLEGNINHKIEEAGYDIVILQNNNFEDMNKLIQEYSIDMVVIDHYDIDYNFEKQLKIANDFLTLMVLDDTYQKHHCDILLNHNIGADEKRYKDLVPQYCKLKCGSEYTLIREEFHAYKNRPKIRNTVPTVFIAMGGCDSQNINHKIIETLKNIDNIHMIVVTTIANKNIDVLQSTIKYHSNMELYVNSNEIAKLMYKSDLAIIAPSVIVHEVLYLDIPFVAIKSAKNQEYIYTFLKEKGYMVMESFDSKVLLEHVVSQLENE